MDQFLEILIGIFLNNDFMMLFVVYCDRQWFVQNKAILSNSIKNKISKNTGNSGYNNFTTTTFAVIIGDDSIQSILRKHFWYACYRYLS